MKLKNVGIIIPWEGTDGERHMTRFRYRGEVDRRQVRKDMRKAFKPLGIVVNSRTLDMFIAHRKYDLGIGEA